MFAPEDSFPTTILGFDGCRSILCLAPAERGSSQCMRTTSQRRSEAPHPIYELAGPRVYPYKELLQTIAREARLQPALMPVPFALWHTLARVAEMLPRPSLTRNQVKLMQVDTTASDQSGFPELGIPPRSLEEELQAMLKESA
jgi:uncharacterized protein YbjT (DUF2867 family)